MKDEILEGIKMAVEHGSSLEAAAQSFINAGYNPAEVREAAKQISLGASSIISSSQTQQTTSKSLPPLPKLPTPQKNSQQTPSMQSQPVPQIKPLPVSISSSHERKSGGDKNIVLIIVLVVVLLILLGLLGIVFLKGDAIVSSFLS